MTRVFVTICAALLTSTLAPAAFACTFAEEGWVAANNEAIGPPDGPFIVVINNAYDREPIPTATLIVADPDGQSVAGQSEVVVAPNGRFVLVTWTPDTELDVDSTYDGALEVDGEPSAGDSKVVIRPRVSDDEVSATLSEISTHEYRTWATRECCMIGETCFTRFDSDEPCGGAGEQVCENTQSCWDTSYKYMVRPQAELDASPGAVPRRHMLQLVDSETGEPPPGLNAAIISESMPVRLQGPDLEAETELPFCFEVMLTDILTGESESVAESCFDESGVEGTAPEEEPEVAPDSCEPNTYVEVDRDGHETPVAGPDVATDDGCAGCAGAGMGSASWLLLLVAGLARQRRKSRRA